MWAALRVARCTFNGSNEREREMSSVSINNMIFNLYIFKRCFQLKIWQKHASHFSLGYLWCMYVQFVYVMPFMYLSNPMCCIYRRSTATLLSFIPPTWRCFVYIIITSSSTKYLSMPIFAVVVIVHAFKKTIWSMTQMVKVKCVLL